MVDGSDLCRVFGGRGREVLGEWLRCVWYVLVSVGIGLRSND